jgi:MFS transporter, AAHS family, 4-hydroxybenzoate transporter
MPAHREPPVDVNAVLDGGRLNRYQAVLVLLTALTVIFDGIDNQLLGVTIPSLMADWNVARGAFAPVVALGYLGMVIGGAIAGLAGDRLGRRVALLASMVVFGLATLAVAAADAPGTLGLLRLLAGIGLGGAMPNAAALAAEFVPRRQRPLAVTVTIVCVPLGGMLAGLIAIPALPAIGWRGLFAIGGAVPIVAAVVLAVVLPESPRYLARHPARWPELARTLLRMGHDTPVDASFALADRTRVERAPLAAIFEPGLLRDTLALWLAFFSNLLGVYLGFSWLPSILSGAGLGTTVASSGITAFNLGGVFGALTGGYVISRIGSRVPMLAMTAGAVVCAGILSLTRIDSAASVAFILAMLTLTGGFINAAQTTMFALAAHVYPTAMRATGVGTAVSIGRTGAIISGYAGPWALELAGSSSFFGLMTAAMASTFIGLALVRRHIPPAHAPAAAHD